jgi:hypothetical protein
LTSFFWQHPKIFVYVACPGYYADEFLLPLDQKCFLPSFLAKKNLTLDDFFDKKTLKCPVTTKALEQF